ncbi:DUF5979 domain-containing protein [Microbacterium sp. 2P01SA-2]|uniref:DUF5979 domain-containing protein n=1 Tax=unclassified Microbacterium TaxID=2609290 RepID=UPI0039A16313
MEHTAAGARPRRRSAASAVLAVALLAVGLWGGAGPAVAAGTSAVLDTVEFTNNTFQDQSVQTLKVTWHASESPATPTLRVEFDLPSELIGQGTTFSIGNGTCTVTANRVECVIEDDYVLENPYDIRGEFEIRAQVDLKNVADLPGVTFTVGGVSTLPVHVDSRYCSENCEYGGVWGPWKSGWYDNPNDTVHWWVGVPTRGDGIQSADDGLSLAPGQTVTVTDRFDETNPFTLVEGSPRVQRATCVAVSEWNDPSLMWVDLDRSQYTVSDGGRQVQFVTTAGEGCAGQDAGENAVALTGSVYQVNWDTIAQDGGKGVSGPGSYDNNATIEIDGVVSDAGSTATRYDSSGSATGQSYARFQLQKTFDTAADVIRPHGIRVDYTIEYPGGIPAPTSGTIELDAGNDWSYTSPEIYAGSTVTLSEVDPWPSNVDGSAVLTLDGAPVAAARDGSFSFTATHSSTPLAVSLTNAATLQTQVMQARKELDNPDGVRMPEGTAFELTASWPANPELAIAAGSASVELPADGSVVEFPALPVGAEVSFAETMPADVAGGTWIGSTVSPQTLTIGPGSVGATVTATNVIARDVGSFAIEKKLTGDAADLVVDRTFEVGYSWPANGDLGIEAGSGTVTVTADEDAVTVIAPAGAEVTLSEAPVAITGGTWAAPTFEPGNTLTLVQDETARITLTNLIDLNTGGFSIHKVVEGNAAGRVPADAEFTVHYAYPAGVGFGAAEGELTVGAGETVTSPQLPYGAEVTLTEAAPADVEGATWEAPAFSPATVTIGDGTVVEVTLTNTLTAPEVVVTSPGGSSTSNPGGLAASGVADGEAIVWWVTGSAVLMLAIGAVVLTASRRRRAQSGAAAE